MPHISYSELKNWHHCPFYHKLVNIDKLKVFEGNEYTAFGTALHSVCEDLLTEEINIPKPELFNQKFRDEIKKLKSEELNKKLIIDMFEQGGKLSEQVLPSLDKYFDDCEVFMAEEKLYEPISGFDDYLFKGFVDLIIKEGDNYHIIDWKTCSWGWDAKRKSDKMVVYQLIFYKHYYAMKYDIDPNNIECHFGLLKRTAKNNEVEIFKVTSGKRRTENAMELLVKALHNIDNGVYIKNKLSCANCEFRGTKYCP